MFVTSLSVSALALAQGDLERHGDSMRQHTSTISRGESSPGPRAERVSNEVFQLVRKRRVEERRRASTRRTSLPLFSCSFRPKQPPSS